MNIAHEMTDAARATFNQLSSERRETMMGIYIALSLQEGVVEPPFTGAMQRDELFDAIADAGEDDIFKKMDFHFVVEMLASRKLLTLYPEGNVRLGDHPGGDPAAISILGGKQMTRRERFKRSMRSQSMWGPSGCLDR